MLKKNIYIGYIKHEKNRSVADVDDKIYIL